MELQNCRVAGELLASRDVLTKLSNTITQLQMYHSMLLKSAAPPVP
jgi:hypothetical protein